VDQGAWSGLCPWKIVTYNGSTSFDKFKKRPFHSVFVSVKFPIEPKALEEGMAVMPW
jgi:hypothetical protein